MQRELPLSSSVRVRLHTALALALWLIAVSVSAAPGPQTYTVRRGDTLSEIAEKVGIPLSRLAERNNLGKNYRIYAGQRLIIPARLGARTAPPRAPAPPTLPARVKRAITQAKVKPGRWKHIVIHHSAVDSGTLSGMDRYHRNERHMENGLAYHFVIGNGNGLGDGEIGIGARWAKQLDGGHVISLAQNRISLGICLVGNFDKEKPTAKQMERLTALVRVLMGRCKLGPNAVTTHQQINVVHTRCPGRNFPTQTFLNSLKATAR